MAMFRVALMQWLTGIVAAWAEGRGIEPYQAVMVFSGIAAMLAAASTACAGPVAAAADQQPEPGWPYAPGACAPCRQPTLDGTHWNGFDTTAAKQFPPRPCGAGGGCAATVFPAAG